MRTGGMPDVGDRAMANFTGIVGIAASPPPYSKGNLAWRAHSSRSQLQPEDIRHVSLIVAPEYLANCRGCRVRHNRPRACPELGRELVRQCHLYQPGKLRGSTPEIGRAHV